MSNDELTQKMFERLNRPKSSPINLSSVHTLDEDVIKGLLKSIYDAGYALNIVLFEQLATDANWGKSVIKFFKDKVKHLEEGKGFQMPNDKETGKQLFADIID